MIKTTFLSGEYPPMQGGIADHIAYLAERLKSSGVKSSVLIQRRWGAMGHSNEDSNVYPVVPNWNWRCWPAVSGFITAHRPHILHIQYQAAAFDLGGWVNWLPWYLKKRSVETGLVTTFHDLRVPYLFPKAGRLRWQAILTLARHSDAVICTNREDLRTLQRALEQTPPARISHMLPSLVRIPLGSNVEPQPPADFDRTAWRSRYQVNDQTLLLAYFGFLNESKGGEELITALALLREQGLDARLLFIGGDVGHADPTNVAYARRVRRLIEQYRLDDVVHFTGYVDLPRVSANLLAIDAVVMPYRDGVSFRRTTLIAALRHGCPVVSTNPANLANVPEIHPGKNMLLAPPGDAPALARSIASLAGEASLQEELSAGAKELGRLFDWRKIAADTFALYRAVTEKKGEGC